jgi:ribosomal protein S6
MNFEAPADVPAELGRLMRISDDVIRHRVYLQTAPMVKPEEAVVAAE